MGETSRASSKLLHGGLRYLETGQFRLVGKALHARTDWLELAPHLCHRLEMLLPMYRDKGRSQFTISAGIRIYDVLAMGSGFPRARVLKPSEVLALQPGLSPDGLVGAWAFFDAQMDDSRPGQLGDRAVLRPGRRAGHRSRGPRPRRARRLRSHRQRHRPLGHAVARDRCPASRATPLDWVRGSHIVLDRVCPAAMLLEVPGSSRIFFVLPYQGRTLVGTTEVRQSGPNNPGPSEDEIRYLLDAHNHYLTARRHALRRGRGLLGRAAAAAQRRQPLRSHPRMGLRTHRQGAPHLRRQMDHRQAPGRRSRHTGSCNDQTPRYTVHPSAIVDDGAQIGEGSRVWHFAHVCAGARIGKGVSLGQNVFVGNKVVIGDQCKVQNNVSVYDNVTLEEGVFCGPSMVFTNVYNPRSLIERKSEYRDTLVKRGATLGANCTIVCGTTIGEFAFIGAGAVINKDVKPYALMVGVPARQIGWMSEYGEQDPAAGERPGRIHLPAHGRPLCPQRQHVTRLGDLSHATEPFTAKVRSTSPPRSA